MLKNHRFQIVIILLLVTNLFTRAAANSDAFNSQNVNDTTITVPLGGNAWRNGSDTTGGKITNEGIIDWTNHNISFTAYFRVAKSGLLKLWLHLKVPSGQSRLSVSALNNTKQLSVTGTDFKDQYAGEWETTDTGYIAVQIKGISKSGATFADISSLKLSGSAIDHKTAYVKNNEGDFFYWGRRGPSVHLGYVLPDQMNAEWFYNEVTVPAGNDVIGSYFMADGFGEGYFGMQVNSATERRILFSVWSPFTTDKPEQITDDQKIIMLKKGSDVHTGEFGNEGSGGQSTCCTTGKQVTLTGFCCTLSRVMITTPFIPPGSLLLN